MSGRELAKFCSQLCLYNVIGFIGDVQVEVGADFVLLFIFFMRNWIGTDS